MQEQILMGYQYPYSWLGDLEYVQMLPRLDNLFQGIFLLFWLWRVTLRLIIFGPYVVSKFKKLKNPVKYLKDATFEQALPVYTY